MIAKFIRKNKAFFLMGAILIIIVFAVSKRSNSSVLNLNERIGSLNVHRNLKCSKWAVTASSSSTPSEGIRRFLYDESWCLVVVRLSGESSFKIVSSLPPNIFVLDETEQRKMNYGSLSMEALPLTLSSKRNTGYLFAIAHGAKMIFDFDPDNEIKFWIPNALPRTKFAALNHFEDPKVSDFVSLKVKDESSLNCPIYEPGPSPLNSYSNSVLHCISSANLVYNSKKADEIGILHSSIDFDGSTLKKNLNVKEAGNLLPHGVYIPFATESSIFYKAAFWALFVPSGRDGDVLRSFVVKYICDIYYLKMGLTSQPLTWIRRRNANKTYFIRGDLRLDVKQLIKDLSLFRNKSKDIPSPTFILGIWKYLQEKNYISKEDLAFVHSWIQTLIHLNYQFPGRHTGDRNSIVSVDDSIRFNVGKMLPVMKDLGTPKCQVKKFKSFWTSDLHDGCRSDFPLVLADMNQTVWVSGIKGKNNRYGIFDYPGVRFSDKLSPVVKKITSHSSSVSEGDIKANGEYYAKNPIDVDAFFCEFPASMCEIWIPLGKPIFFLPAHRYNLGRCSMHDWNRLNRNLKGLDPNRPNFMGALSRYDLEYLDHYTNTLPTLFPSYGGVQLKKFRYMGKQERFLFFGWNKIDFVPKDAKRQNIIYMKDYKLEDLVLSKGIIYNAYSVMSYKLTEFYSMGIPLFMPSLKFYRKIGFGNDRTCTNSNYCKDTSLSTFPHDPESAHPFNPNLIHTEDPDAETYWLQYSDFYDWPHIIHFDNVSHLHYLIDNTDLKTTSANMLRDVKIRKDLTYNTWCKSINQL